MKFGFFMNALSAHQLPLAREVAKLVGIENFVYVTASSPGQSFQTQTCQDSWITENKNRLDACDVVFTGIRDFSLFERRYSMGLKTFYTSERWFKPFRMIPGWFKAFAPSYQWKIKRFTSWIKKDPKARYFAIGPWAKKDALLMGVPENKIVDWGYFVSPSTYALNEHRSTISNNSLVKLLWVGRMLDWKRVDTIIRAVACLNTNAEAVRYQLTIVGCGPQESYLRRIASRLSVANTQLSQFIFTPSVSMDKVRELMHQNDIYVLSSNAYEGWGAALSEAIEEGMFVIGTNEAGASAAMLPAHLRFKSGDWRQLSRILMSGVDRSAISYWSAKVAAERLVAIGEDI